MVLKDLKVLTVLGLDTLYMLALKPEQREELLGYIDHVIELGKDDSVSEEDFALYESTQEIPDVDGQFTALVAELV